MKLLNYFFGLVALVLVFAGCKNDVDLNAPYKEIPSIYAVLNPYENVQTIRINKVFLGEGDANVMAKVSDSVNYAPDELSVTMKYKVSEFGKTVSGTITFTEAVLETAPGAFSTSQRVYQTNSVIPSAITIYSNSSSTNVVIVPVYTLTVLNKHTGNVFTATASPVNKVYTDNLPYGDLRLPHYPNYPPDDQLKEDYFVDYNSRPGVVHFPPKWGNEFSNSAVYKLVISTVYYNIAGNEKQYDAVDYVFGNRYPKDAAVVGGAKFISTSFSPNDYFSAVGIALSKKNIDKSI
ncbi:MAG: hypothetical protein JNL60_06320, partial [Bacteroidia bacterium]|nr:hypothetical protein [Bacteroidia bacterium]